MARFEILLTSACMILPPAHLLTIIPTLHDRIPCNLQLGDNIFAKTRTAKKLRKEADNFVTIIVKDSSIYNHNELFTKTDIGMELSKAFKQ